MTAAAVPHGVICLLSSLQFHEITTQMPVKTWGAIKRGTRMPTCKGLNLQIVRLTGPAFAEGIEKHGGDAVPILVYSAGMTVVDCFKFRTRIGLDVALEALREARTSASAQFARNSIDRGDMFAYYPESSGECVCRYPHSLRINSWR